MDSDKYLEGQSMQRPPLFESDSFIYWKNRFETYVTNGDFQPIIQNPETKLDEVVPFEKQIDDLKRRLAKNNEAKMVIYNVLPKKEYERIFMLRKKSSDEDVFDFWCEDEGVRHGCKRLQEVLREEGRFVRTTSERQKRPFQRSRRRQTWTKVKGSALDVEIQIILLDNVQSHRETKTKEHLLEGLGAIAGEEDDEKIQDE
ncbi:hypothetical protein Tco_0189118 [Tanacetum coccineum]